jgi:hypothetical protein
VEKEVVPVRQKRGTEGGPVVKPVGVRSPIADPWELGASTKELCWRCSQVTRVGFAGICFGRKGSRSLQVGSGTSLDPGQG